eukprot:m.42789 g.42789  ORF g.42789 m.42789 type:complete len:170 (+) comp10736_c1_seq1:168-677(+)
MGWSCSCHGWADYFIVVCAAFALAGWATFVIGFGLENANTDQLGNWGTKSERFLWFILAIFGVLAGFSSVIYAISKRRWLLTVTVISSLISMMAVGAPLQQTGNFIAECYQSTNTAGETHQGVGCQEVTYDNFTLMFAGSLVFSVLQVSTHNFENAYDDSFQWLRIKST